eukprot:m.66251 g.66251  ORF g.66251 m.66251 type:complete len:1176 (-) comp13585_c0_seq2:2829-6356(-)
MSFASTAANVEFRDIPVKFLGQEKIPRNADNERAMADFFQDKSKHKDLHGFAKEMLMSLNPRQGWLSFSPKAGGQALNISLTTLLSIAAVSTKFAFVVTDDSNSPTATIFAFQFKRRSDSENKAFLAALRRASHADPTSTTTNLPRGRAMSYTSCTSSHAHIALPGNATGNTNQPSTNLGDVTALQAKIRSLETQLVEERNKSASAEVARLSAELHRATAEREAEEARRQVESIRKEMALVAADMSSELAQMKMDFSEERALQIVQELHLIKNALSIIESNQNASSQPLWTRAANLENLKKEESSNHPRIAKMQSATDTSNAADTSNQRLLSFARRVSSVAFAPANGQDVRTEDMSEMELRGLINRQNEELEALRSGSDRAQQLENELSRARSENARLQQHIKDLQEELEDLQSEKNILADTIAGLKAQSNTAGSEKSLTQLTSMPNGKGRLHGSGHLNTNGLRNASDMSAFEPITETDGRFSNVEEMQPEPLEDRFDVILDKVNGGLGFSITGGADDEVESGDPSIYITAIVTGGAAEKNGQIRVGDKIVSVNGINIECVNHEEAVRVLQRTSAQVRLVLARIAGSLPSIEPQPTQPVPKMNLTGGASSQIQRRTPSASHADSTSTAKNGSHASRNASRTTVERKTSSLPRPATDAQQPGNAANPAAEEEVEEEIVHISFAKRDDGLGFSIAGGRDHPVEDGDNHMYITAVIPNSAAAADGRLKLGDKLLVINNTDVSDMNHADVVTLLASQPRVELTVSRLPEALLTNEPAEVVIDMRLKRENGGFGFSIAGGMDLPVATDDTAVYITHIVPGSAADHDGRLQIGDRLLEVNGRSVVAVEHAVAAEAIRSSGEYVDLIVARITEQIEETLEIEFERGPGGLGFSIAGGTDDPESVDDPGIYVVEIIPGASAERDGRLRKGDRILEVNGHSCENVTHNEAVLMLQASTTVKLLVSRLMDITENTFKVEDEILDIELEKSAAHGLGFSIAGGLGSEIEDGDPGIYVSDITPGGPAGQPGKLRFGDRLLEVNNVQLDGVTHDEAVDVLRSCTNAVRLKILRAPQDLTDDGEILVTITLRRLNEGFGFSIAGGKDAPVEDGDNGIYITSIIEGGAADVDGNLQIGDKLIYVDGVDLTNALHSECVEVLQRAGDEVRLVISRLPFDETQQVDAVPENN